MKGVVTAAAKISTCIYFSVSSEQMVYILLYKLLEM